MNEKFLAKEKLFINTTQFSDILYKSNGYEEFYKNIIESNIDYKQEKTYEIAASNFFDFNNHLYEDINHMNSISCGIYIELGLITYRLFIWGSRGEGFEIFKHVLRAVEIEKLKNEEDIKNYMYTHLNELEEGINKTYNIDTKSNFEKFGMSIETREILIKDILQSLSIENNMKDLKK